MNKINICLSSLLLLLVSNASAAFNCPYKIERVGLLLLVQYIQEGRCLITIEHSQAKVLQENAKTGNFKSTTDTSKRSYAFGSDGYAQVYDPNGAQELLLLPQKNDLKYSVQNSKITVLLPSGQKIEFASGAGEKKMAVTSFTGFTDAKETEKGFELIPKDADLILTSSVANGIPHAKNSKFSLITSAGKQASTFSASQIFDLKTNKDLQDYPILKKSFSVPAVPAAVTAMPASAPAKAIETGIDHPSVAAPASKDNSLCEDSQVNLKELNMSYLRIQGELSISKLAYFYLKDLGESTENLESKIKNLLQQKDLKLHQDILQKKISLNAGLSSLKSHFTETQKKWSTKESENFLLSDVDF